MMKNMSLHTSFPLPSEAGRWREQSEEEGSLKRKLDIFSFPD